MGARVRARHVGSVLHHARVGRVRRPAARRDEEATGHLQRGRGAILPGHLHGLCERPGLQRSGLDGAAEESGGREAGGVQRVQRDDGPCAVRAGGRAHHAHQPHHLQPLRQRHAHRGGRQRQAEPLPPGRVHQRLRGEAAAGHWVLQGGRPAGGVQGNVQAGGREGHTDPVPDDRHAGGGRPVPDLHQRDPGLWLDQRPLPQGRDRRHVRLRAQRRQGRRCAGCAGGHVGVFDRPREGQPARGTVLQPSGGHIPRAGEALPCADYVHRDRLLPPLAPRGAHLSGRQVPRGCGTAHGGDPLSAVRAHGRGAPVGH
mmetsp:Transcript_18169/g.40277  ORF Transcript_18169/g.40277 Transcript_18169/m.40277 type:complete len:314 (+) Transcript_18169:2554-3495(+)